MVHRHAAGALPVRMRLVAGVMLITVAAGDHHGNGDDSRESSLPRAMLSCPRGHVCCWPDQSAAAFGTLPRHTHGASQYTGPRPRLRLVDALMVTHLQLPAGQAVYPVMPDCTSLQPTPCEILPNVTADGTIDYKTGYFVRHDHCRNRRMPCSAASGACSLG